MTLNTVFSVVSNRREDIQQRQVTINFHLL
jgi:hypothetical protein